MGGTGWRMFGGGDGAGRKEGEEDAQVGKIGVILTMFTSCNFSAFSDIIGYTSLFASEY